MVVNKINDSTVFNILKIFRVLYESFCVYIFYYLTIRMGLHCKKHFHVKRNNKEIPKPYILYYYVLIVKPS